jgi:hypothetical protein
MCGKCITMTLKRITSRSLRRVHRWQSQSARGLPYARLNVGARRFVENTPW